ncbi:hypothetical protein SDC9_77663 [bioreactor metagenome]|uniref:Uncharacterized protein n=1 Tax=bioreactor metagenome TaxID=1076179 RepID=A0A644YRH2_9ZZZZ
MNEYISIGTVKVLFLPVFCSTMSSLYRLPSFTISFNFKCIMSPILIPKLASRTNAAATLLLGLNIFSVPSTVYVNPSRIVLMISLKVSSVKAKVFLFMNTNSYIFLFCYYHNIVKFVFCQYKSSYYLKLLLLLL